MGSSVNGVLRHVCRAAFACDGMTDQQLLERFITRRDDGALDALVRRHGPMVWGVCRRVLPNEADAEDAFQATFLVLLRKATSIRTAVGNWLYGVAFNTALKARAMNRTRRTKERLAATRPAPETRDEVWHRLLPLLDQELGGLPDKLRTPIVFCDLEGRTIKQTARELGVPAGTVASRLARGRVLLAKRLRRHGIALSGGALALMLSENAASAGLPVTLTISTLEALSVFRDAATPAVGMVSTKIIALTEGVLKSMLLTRIKTALAATVVFGAVFCAAGFLSGALATEPNPQGQASKDDVHDRVTELKQQLQQIQKRLASLEQETQPTTTSRDAIATLLAERLKYRVPFEIGYAETKEGGRIEIREVWGKRPSIEVGGQYLVRGKYVLPRGTRGKLYFYETTGDGKANQLRGGDYDGRLRFFYDSLGQATSPAGTATLDLQSVELDKQEGEFVLMHGMGEAGHFHLILTEAERYSRTFANVYFGTGDNVLRKQP